MPNKPANATAMSTIGKAEFSQKRLLSSGKPFGLNHQYPAAAARWPARAKSTMERRIQGFFLF
jgi:hypothetical protein